MKNKLAWICRSKASSQTAALVVINVLPTSFIDSVKVCNYVSCNKTN